MPFLKGDTYRPGVVQGLKERCAKIPECWSWLCFSSSEWLFPCRKHNTERCCNMNSFYRHSITECCILEEEMAKEISAIWINWLFQIKQLWFQHSFVIQEYWGFVLGSSAACWGQEPSLGCDFTNSRSDQLRQNCSYFPFSELCGSFLPYARWATHSGFFCELPKLTNQAEKDHILLVS